MRKLFNRMLLLVAVFMGSADASGGFVSLGAGAGCTFNTLQGGNLQNTLNLNPTEIRLVNNAVYKGQFFAASSVTIRGGFDSCVDATNDIQGTDASVIDGDFSGTTLTLDVNGAYELEQIKIINGSNPTDRGGGLLLKASDMVVNMNRVTVENNEAKWGGGIFKGSNLGVLLIIKDSIIKDNFAGFGAGLGGGIYYDLGGEVIVYGDTQITGNQAIRGGGVYLDNAQATFVGGANESINSGITLNKATEHGGGLYSETSQVEISGGMKHIPGIGLVGESGKNYNILFNESDSDLSNTGDGGGLYFFFSSVADLEAVTIAFNKSNAFGGGMLASFNSVVTVGRPGNSTCQITNLMGCNFIIQNTAKAGAGGIYVYAAANVSIESVNFNNNRSNFATVAYVGNTDSQLTIDSSVFYENGNSGMDGFGDQYVLHLVTGGKLKITHSTAINNRAVSGFISNSGATVESYNNFLFNPQTTGPWLVSSGAFQSDYECMYSDDTNNSMDFPNYSYVVNSNFLNLNFVDAANNNYHLIDNSSMIDFVGLTCPSINPGVNHNALDIDGEPRTSFVDLGADENLSNDIIFKDDFE